MNSYKQPQSYFNLSCTPISLPSLFEKPLASFLTNLNLNVSLLHCYSTDPAVSPVSAFSYQLHAKRYLLPRKRSHPQKRQAEEKQRRLREQTPQLLAWRCLYRPGQQQSGQLPQRRT